jgi:hypothetical protein
MNRSFMAVMVVSSILGGAVCNRLQAQLPVPVTWDGGNGRWEIANWTKDGIPGQTATATMSDNTGGRGGLEISIGGGAQVEHDHNNSNTVPGALGDFKPRMDLNGPGSLTIKEGAVLSFDSHSDTDGRWTRVGMNVNLDNGTIRRTHSAPSESGGQVIFGYSNELLANTKISISLSHGGRIENDGKMIFGKPQSDLNDLGHNTGIEVVMTINNGTLDLTGGHLWPDFFGSADGELVFIYGRKPTSEDPNHGLKNEKYVINFTGPGSITVDGGDPINGGGGIYVGEIDESGTYFPKGGFVPDLYTPISYENLWTLGILQANGLSGLTGATFSNYFTTTNFPGDDDYKLTSLVVPGADGDYNDDGVVNAADYTKWRDNFGSSTVTLPNDPTAGTVYAGDYTVWKNNFGATAGSGSGLGSGGAVPEPASLMLVVLGLVGPWIGRRRFVR